MNSGHADHSHSNGRKSCLEKHFSDTLSGGKGVVCVVWCCGTVLLVALIAGRACWFVEGRKGWMIEYLSENEDRGSRLRNSHFGMGIFTMKDRVHSKCNHQGESLRPCTLFLLGPQTSHPNKFRTDGIVEYIAIKNLSRYYERIPYHVSRNKRCHTM